jgi:hypothetical protein
MDHLSHRQAEDSQKSAKKQPFNGPHHHQYLPLQTEISRHIQTPAGPRRREKARPQSRTNKTTHHHIMKKTLSIALAIACTLALGGNAMAADKKKDAKKPAKSDKAKQPAGERTVRGELVCAHCALGIGEGCQNAIKVSRKGKDGKEIQQVFLLTGDAADALGKGDGQKVIAKGRVKREGKGKDAKLYLAASSLAADKGK